MARVPLVQGLLLLTGLGVCLSASFNIIPKHVEYLPYEQDEFGNTRYELNEGLVEQLDYDPKTRHVLVGGEERVTLFQLEKNLTLTEILRDYYDDYDFTQVIFCGGFWIATAKHDSDELNGRLLIFKRHNRKQGFLDLVHNIPVGGHSPNDIAVSKDCKRLLVTVENPPFYAGFVCDEGLEPFRRKRAERQKRDLCGGFVQNPGYILEVCFKTTDLCTRPSLRRLGFEHFNHRVEELEATGYFVKDKRGTLSDDAEPESICLNEEGTRAYVTLQDNNAIAVLDCPKDGHCEVTSIKGLGYLDLSVSGNGADVSDGDDEINIDNWPVRALHQPDQIQCLKIDGRDYLVTANEGKFDEAYVVQVQDIDLDPTVFPNADELKEQINLGELFIFEDLGDTDGDGDYDELYMIGSRTMAIWDSDLNMVAHTADNLAQMIAQDCPEVFNADTEDNYDTIAESFDFESDEAGLEIESLASLNVCNGTLDLMFGGFENPGGIFVTHVNRSSPSSGFTIHQLYMGITDKDPDLEWDELYQSRRGHLFHVEALKVIDARDSPCGKPVLLAGASSSSTVEVFEIDVDCEDP